MATAIRAIPTLYGETAKSFECEAKRTEQNPGTQDYLHLEVDFCLGPFHIRVNPLVVIGGSGKSVNTLLRYHHEF